ncbi:MAG: M1 family metallopeptidase [Gemmatimonadales bacterium]
MKRIFTFTLFLAAGLTLAAAPMRAQNPTLLPPTNQEIFAPLELRDAGEIRLGSGKPGRGYWQQRSDYSIEVSLDSTTHRVTGSETITYTNNSPDSLSELWLQLDQNLFTAESRGALVNSSNRWRGAFAQGGDHIERVDVVRDGTRSKADYMVNDTRMRIDLAEPLTPDGGTIQLGIDWSFVIPEYGADRMGRLEAADGWVYEVAQWYPRMYVYDDVNGWNPLPYIGQGEFYLEYGSFDVAITAPSDFVVVATGELLNPKDVLTKNQQQRLEQARHTARTIHIVSAQEVGTPESRPTGKGNLTWRYHADNVRDFSWAASKAFIWDATSWEDVLIMSVYPKEGLGPDNRGRAGWEDATQYARHTISYYSEHFFRYPYPVAINVAGIAGGMEYPMIVFCSVRARGQGLFGVTDHELGHSWFPMIVGNDERRYAWMDEGFNTFLNHYSNLDFYGDTASRSQRTSAPYIARMMQQPISDQPIMTHPDKIRGQGLGFMGYRKPGFGLIMLREVVLGHERFDKAFRTYIKRWAFKHPKPADFFRTIDDLSGEDLSWFWRGWFYTTDLLDQSVDSVTVSKEGTHIHLNNLQGLVMPVHMRIQFADSSTVDRKLPVEIWQTSDLFSVLVDDPRAVVAVTLDPDVMLPDANRENNEWRRKDNVL